MLPLMLRSMSWRLHVIAGNDHAAAKIAARVTELLDGRLVVERIEPYWKINEHRIVSANLALRATTLPDATVEVLRLASTVAGGWLVTTPEEARDGSWRFDGSASANFRIAGVAFAMWTVSPPETALHADHDVVAAAEWRALEASIRRRRRMFVLDDRFLTACAFVTGFATGRDDRVLEAFSAWLADRQAAYKNYSWEAMVLAEAGLAQLGDVEPTQLTNAQHEDAVRALCDLLLKFFGEVERTTASACE